MIKVKNLTRQPQLIDDDGHMLGGGEIGKADEKSRFVTQGVDSGFFVEVIESKPEPVEKTNSKITAPTSSSAANKES